MCLLFVYTAFPFSIGHILFFEMKTRQKKEFKHTVNAILYDYKDY